MQICKLKKKKKKAASFDAFHQPHSEIFLHGVVLQTGTET